MNVQSRKSTKERLIDAASMLFAEKGFADTTVAEICEAASANIAAVNYYFNDKESLYDEVWRHAFNLAATAFPLPTFTATLSVEKALSQYAKAILGRIFSENENGLFAKLLVHEMARPTIALEKIANEALLPQSQFVSAVIIRELGPNIDAKQLQMAKSSIIAQCAFYNCSKSLRQRVLNHKQFNADEINEIAAHIARFTMGGLHAIKHEST